MGVSTSVKPYILKGRIKGYAKNPITIKLYRYILTQYTPSVYAEISFVINESDFLTFKDIDKLAIKQRLIDVWFEPELYDIKANKAYNSGPFTYCILTYKYTEDYPNDMDTRSLNNENTRLIHLMCIDPVFYSMTLKQNIASFGEVPVSSVVEKLVSNNGGNSKKIISTDYSYKWLQTRMTDYDMIRSLLPYSRSTNKDLLYTFFMFNSEAYFAPISSGRTNPIKIFFDSNKQTPAQFDTGDLKFLIDKYGSKDNLLVFNKGYTTFSAYKPAEMGTEAYTSNIGYLAQHRADGSRSIDLCFDDKSLLEIYLGNLRQRVSTFSRLLSLTTTAVPELTPVDSVELINEKDGSRKDLDGTYYIASISYTYGMTEYHPTVPLMTLTLCSELDAKSMDKPEGKPKNDSEGTVISNTNNAVMNQIKNTGIEISEYSQKTISSDDIIESAKNAAGELSGIVNDDFINSAASTLNTTVTNTMNTVMPQAATALSDLSTEASTALSAATANSSGILISAANTASTSLTNIANSGVDFATAASQASTVLNNVVSQASTAVNAVATGATTTINNVATSTAKTLQEAADKANS